MDYLLYLFKMFQLILSGLKKGFACFTVPQNQYANTTLIPHHTLIVKDNTLFLRRVAHNVTANECHTKK